MPQKFEVRRGFMRFQRLGPVKFGEQSRWSMRAPESTGLWAFPFPHFDLFYAYHRYMDLLPKELQGRQPKDPKWWRRIRAEGEAPYGGVHEVPSELDDDGDFPLERYGDLHWDLEYENSATNGYVISEFYRAQEDWINTVGKRILPLREFWYRGLVYSHFRPDGSVGGWTMGSQDEGNEWTLTSTDELAKFMRKPGGVLFSNSYDGAGKPRSFRYSKDHLEVFIPRGRGELRDRI